MRISGPEVINFTGDIAREIIQRRIDDIKVSLVALGVTVD
jgi:hypothetical protein